MPHPARLALLALSVVLVAAPAGAQYGVRRGSPRDGIVEIPRVPTPMAALVVRYGGDLQLSQKQLDVIQGVRQHQDSLNAPWLRALDSLRNGPRPVNPLDLSQEQREAIARKRAAVKTAMDAMKLVDTDARQQVMAVLSPDQQQKAGRLENDARELARAQSQRRADYGGYGRRTGDMDDRMQLSPED